MTIVDNGYATKEAIPDAARKHCAKYGKAAVFMTRYTIDSTIFTCQ